MLSSVVYQDWYCGQKEELTEERRCFQEILEVLKRITWPGFLIGVIYLCFQLYLPDRHAQRPIAFRGERKTLAIMVISPGKLTPM